MMQVNYGYDLAQVAERNREYIVGGRAAAAPEVLTLLREGGA